MSQVAQLGVAHTYLAAEALEIGAANLGYTIKVETNGSVGVKIRRVKKKSPKQMRSSSAVIRK